MKNRADVLVHLHRDTDNIFTLLVHGLCYELDIPYSLNTSVVASPTVRSLGNVMAMERFPVRTNIDYAFHITGTNDKDLQTKVGKLLDTLKLVTNAELEYDVNVSYRGS